MKDFIEKYNKLNKILMKRHYNEDPPIEIEIENNFITV